MHAGSQRHSAADGEETAAECGSELGVGCCAALFKTMLTGDSAVMVRGADGGVMTAEPGLVQFTSLEELLILIGAYGLCIINHICWLGAVVSDMMICTHVCVSPKLKQHTNLPCCVIGHDV